MPSRSKADIRKELEDTRSREEALLKLYYNYMQSHSTNVIDMTDRITKLSLEVADLEQELAREET